jgi:subtilisin family serine protease
MRGRIRGLSLLMALAMIATLSPTSYTSAASDVVITAAETGPDIQACDSSTCMAPTDPDPGADFVPDQILVRFRPSLTDWHTDRVLLRRGMSRLRRVEAIGVDVLRLPPGLSVEQAVAVLNALPEVEFAEPNYIVRAARISAVEVADQWALSKVQALEAWDSVTDQVGESPPRTLIATVDTGIDRTHPDLEPNIWWNLPESTGTTGFDDDGNGYVDDTWGWDFVNNDNDPFDDNMHGTAVSSVEAAAYDGVGVAGLCPWCDLLAVKVLGSDGSSTLDIVADGIVYATDMGAKVINLSMVASGGSQSLKDAVNYAWDSGALVVAAAGNHGTESQMWPAAYDNVMSIASTNDQDYRSCFSGYSEGYISVAAPGEAILTADLGETGYGTYSGTSLSAPYVAGLAGLLFSLDPASTVAEVRSMIEGTTEDLGPVGTDAFFGTGRINALRAVESNTVPTTPPTGMFVTDAAATGYAHARKLVRDGDTLHWVWHGRDGGQYQVLYATSIDDGITWSTPQVVFGSSAEVYSPALAMDGSNLYVAFASKHSSSYYGTYFTYRSLSGGDWETPVLVLGGSHDAIRPDLYLDPSNGRLHLVAASDDNAPYVYYANSSDAGATWDTSNVDVGYNTRYADVHAFGSEVYIAGRTLEWTTFIFLEIPRYRVFTIRYDGNDWGDLNILATHDGMSSGEYGLSLAGMANRLYLAYEHSGTIRFRTSQDGAVWSDRENLGDAKWPSLTQADDGQAWIMWVKDGNLELSHYTGTTWDPEETLDDGTYPNLKLGIDGGSVEWVATHCSGAPFRLMYDSRVPGVVDTPPIVAVEDPLGGQTVSGTYRVYVKASDDNGLSLVELSIDGGAYVDIMDNFDGSRYFYDWVTIGYADGNHTLQARATDDAAQTTDSPVVNVTLDNAGGPPSVAVVDPVEGQTVGGTYRVLVGASDDVEVNLVELSIDGEAYVNITANFDSTYYYYDWDTRAYANGDYTLQARATDGDAQTTESVVVTVAVDNQAPPSSAPYPVTGVVSGVGSDGWTTVNLSHDYGDSMVVVASANYDNSVAPGVVRISNASGDSFDVRVDGAGGSAISDVTVYYLVVEEGVYTEAEHGIKMEAVKYQSTVTDYPHSFVGESRSYNNSYTNPVVVGQVMTYNDPSFSTFWSRGSSRSEPPSSTELHVGKHVGEDPDNVRGDEVIGYIVIEAGSGIMDTKSYVAELGSDTVLGVGDNPPYSYGFSGLASVSTVIVSQAAMDGSNGGWAVLYGANPLSATNIDLVIDEDQMLDSERSHSSEQVAYLVFGSVSDTPPSVAVIDPVEDQILSGEHTVLVEASDDGAVSVVELSIDGGAFTDITLNYDGAHYTYAWDTTGYAEGNHTVQARATDDGAQTTYSTEVNVTVDNVSDPPIVAVIDPVESQTVGGIYQVLVEASDDNGVSLVELRIDDGAYVDITANVEGNTYSYDWHTTGYANGNHTLQARATDGDAQTTYSTEITVMVDNVSVPPSVAVVNPVDGQTVSGEYTVLVAASDDVGVTLVELSIVGEAYVDITANFDGTRYFYVWETNTYANEDYTLQARATDGDAQTTDSLPVNVTVDNQAPPSSAPFPETGVVSGVGSDGWTTVNLSHDYGDSMVVVASANYDSSVAPGVVRISNARDSSFDVRVDSAGGSAIDDVTVYYLVVEEGVYTEAEHGIKMEAVKYQSTVTDYPHSFVGESRSYSNSYTNPVVVGQVMTYNDPRFSTFWSRGSSRSNPPSSTELRVGKHVGEDPDKTRADELIGYIVIEAGSGTMGTKSYVAELGPDTVKGMSDKPPYSYVFSGLSSVSAVIVSQAAMDGSNGGWAVLYGANPLSATNIDLAIDEDQMKDSERSHSSEQVAYIVFE